MFGISFPCSDALTHLRGCVGLLALLSAGACASTGTGREAPTGDAAIIGSYDGRFVFEAEAFRSTLQLRSAGPGRVAGAFRVSHPIEIQGVASGVVIDNLLRIKVTWRGPEGCDGTIEGILTITERGSELDGPVSVADCGEPVAGRMSFEREVRTPGGDERERVLCDHETAEAPSCR